MGERLGSAEKNDAGNTVVLLLAARGLIAEDPNFSLKTLLAKTGLSRPRFRRCFANKEELLAALTGEEVKGLDEILEAAQPAVQTCAPRWAAILRPRPFCRTGGARSRRCLAGAPAARVRARAGGAGKAPGKAEQTWMQQMGLVGERLTELELFRMAPAPQNTAAAVAVEFAPVEIKQPAEARQPEVKPSEPMPAEPQAAENSPRR